LITVVLTGCAVEPLYDVEAWPDGPAEGRTLVTRNYELRTTVREGDRRAEMVREMEDAIQLYHRLAPAGPPPRTPTLASMISDRESPERAEAFIFAYRDEWAEHTRKTQGSRAALYLNIARGGYASGDSFATFFAGGWPQLYRTMRHEGFHQWIATRFRTRPPPFLEEGLATLFEVGFDTNQLDRPRPAANRLKQLRTAVRRQRLWPLRQLLTMHAGHVVGANDGRQVETFYAQAWAFARFLVEHEEHGPRVADLLAAYADGSAPRNPWVALEQTFGVDITTLQRQYENYVFDLVHVPERED
jgi:hypothetical protein